MARNDWMVFTTSVHCRTRCSERGRAQNTPETQPVAPGQQGLGVINPLEGRTCVVMLKSEGARVKKGEAVCELDNEHIKALLWHPGAARRGRRG